MMVVIMEVDMEVDEDEDMGKEMNTRVEMVGDFEGWYFIGIDVEVKEENR